MNKNYQKTNEDVNDFILGNPTTSKAKATENLVKVIDILLKSNISRVLCEVILQKLLKHIHHI
ncbi:hypothetical protein QCB49_08455 [Cetobacterium somerae]|uniref:hypothetical protein n=1 Tax=Cetobacterium somerae TaxID=188913 RepID=UPI00389260EB